MKSTIHIAVAALLGVGAAVADEKIDFDKHDADNDGYLTHEEWSDVSVSFDEIDADNDKRLTRDELRQSMRKVERVQSRSAGQDDRQQTANQAFDYYDVDDDGYLDERDVEDNEYMRRNFAQWDVDGDGLIDMYDVYERDRDALTWSENTFGEYDLDNDGFLTADEAAQSEYVMFHFDNWDEDGDDLLAFDEVEDTWSYAQY